MVTVDPEAMIILKQGASTSTTPPTGVEASTDSQEPSPSTPEATLAPAEPSETPSSSSSASEPSDAPTTTAPTATTKPAKAPAFQFPPYASPFLFLPAYIEANPATCSAIYVRHPTARPGYSEVPSPFDAGGEVMRFAWEWYAKRRSRDRKGGIMSRWKNPQFTRK